MGDLQPVSIFSDKIQTVSYYFSFYLHSIRSYHIGQLLEKHLGSNNWMKLKDNWFLGVARWLVCYQCYPIYFVVGIDMKSDTVLTKYFSLIF